MRADVYLYTFGYVKSRQKAKTLIESGYVYLNGEKVVKPSTELDEHIEYEIEVRDPCPYVSRGGLKLEKILDTYSIDVKGKTAIDIGASTGGFTHCLLIYGADKVYAVDSGTNQLDEMLLNNKKVVSIENYNARSISLDDIGEYADIITVDVSSISQTYILYPAVKLLKDDGIYIGLIKPQFEVGREKLGKGGIVKDKKSRLFAVNKVIDCAKSCNMKCTGFIKSPIEGGDGNVEFVAIFSKYGKEINEEYIRKTVLN
jgi:23S rRNA (cytidine1920-2'-O)/16S rRNA (cytidine1409-2'-O)-methyltransferase